jgi:hypothetical protein
MPHGVESLKLWRVETEKHGFYARFHSYYFMRQFFLFCFLAQMDKSIVEKNQ